MHFGVGHLLFLLFSVRHRRSERVSAAVAFWMFRKCAVPPSFVFSTSYEIICLQFTTGCRDCRWFVAYRNFILAHFLPRFVWRIKRPDFPASDALKLFKNIPIRRHRNQIVDVNTQTHIQTNGQIYTQTHTRTQLQTNLQTQTCTDILTHHETHALFEKQSRDQTHYETQIYYL